MISTHLKRFSILACLLLSVACKQQTNTDVHTKAVADKNVRTSSPITTLVIISDGICPPCNRKFSSFVSQSLNRKDVFFIISANEHTIDLSQYYDHPVTNVFFDDALYFNRSGIARSSAIMFHDHTAADTMIQITALNLSTATDYVAARLAMNY